MNFMIETHLPRTSMAYTSIFMRFWLKTQSELNLLKSDVKEHFNGYWVADCPKTSDFSVLMNSEKESLCLLFSTFCEL